MTDNEKVRIVEERLDSAVMAKVAAMLNLPTPCAGAGHIVPRGWHFPALGAATCRSELRSDGFPGLGVPMPNLGLPRLLQAGRELRFLGDIAVGEPLLRVSSLADLRQKGEGDAARAIVTVQHELRSVNRDVPLVLEDQIFVLMAQARYQHRIQDSIEVKADVIRTFTPDAIMLFQYSALGFNSHKIHIDRAHATEVEGFPSLVVNGGLVALLIAEFLRGDLGVTPSWLKITNRLPLFCDRPLTLAGKAIDGGWQVRVHNDAGQVSAEVELEIS